MLQYFKCIAAQITVLQYLLQCYSTLQYCSTYYSIGIFVTALICLLQHYLLQCYCTESIAVLITVLDHKL